MSSLYGSTKEKRAGINAQPKILEKIVKTLEDNGFPVESEPATIYEDMNHKYDYRLLFKGKIPPFMNGKKELLVDVKYGKTYTLYDNNGNNTLDQSKSDYIVYAFPYKLNKLTWIKTSVLKECIKIYPPKMRDSYEEGNESKFFYVDTYISDNIVFLKENGCFQINV